MPLLPENLNRVRAKVLLLLAAAAACLGGPGRAAGAVFWVTSTNDSGAGTLRQAILDANAAAGYGITNYIYFNIPAGSGLTIQPLTPLPGAGSGYPVGVWTQVIIDGTTQPGYVSKPIVELDGSLTYNYNAPTVGLTLGLFTHYSVVRGLVINRFTTGIEVQGSLTTIQGNYIGTDVSGTVARGMSTGIWDEHCQGTTIGGPNAADRNVISGNGVGIWAEVSSDLQAHANNLIQGNYIGTDATGTTALGNGLGIREGVATLEDRILNNVISGNSNQAIVASGSGLLIASNLIGTAANGTTALGNGGAGVELSAVYYPPMAGQASISVVSNTIANNRGGGVLVDSGTNMLISANSIYASVGLGIHLVPPANHGQGFPNISSAVNAGGNVLIVRGTLNSAPNQPYTLEFFANLVPNPSDYGEGRTFLGSAQVTTDSAGNGLINVSLPVSVPAGQYLTATATDTNQNTSEFSLVMPVVNGPALPSLALTNSVTLADGSSGTTNAVFGVRLSAASTQTITVDYATADGSATAGTDYQATSGRLTFAPGQTSQALAVPVYGRTLFNTNRTFFVNLANPTNAYVPSAGAQALGTIVNDDPMPVLSVASAASLEGDGGMTPVNYVVFPVSLSTVAAVPVSVNYATVDGTASSEPMTGDYFAASGTITFAPGQTNQTIAVQIVGNTTPQPNRSFYLNLSSPANGTLGQAQAVGTIVDDDTNMLAINDVSLADGSSGTTNAVFTVTLTRLDTQTVTVAYATTDGTAVAGTDYAAASGTLTFTANQTQQTISVSVYGNTLYRPDKVFYVHLTGATNASLTRSQGMATIVNDDPPPVPVPVLTISPVPGNSKVVLSWPTNSTGFSVQVVTSLPAAPGDWQTLGGTPAILNGRYTLTNSALLPSKYYRLIK